MQIALVSLQPLYECIVKSHGSPSSPPPLPPRRSDIYAQYRRTYERLLKDVTGLRGIYLWFALEIDSEPEYIYVGQSQKSSVGLYRRFHDEFRQWYHIFWMKAFGSNRYEQDAILMYNTAKKDYTKEIKNQSRKRGATHLVYANIVDSEVSIDGLETDLYYLLGCPRGNDTVPGPRPKSFSDLAIAMRNDFSSRIAQCQPFDLTRC